jgi:hypothetical protein
VSKIDRVISLIEEKTSALLIEYSDLIEDGATEEILSESIGQITILDELRKEIKIIKAEDD